MADKTISSGPEETKRASQDAAPTKTHSTCADVTRRGVTGEATADLKFWATCLFSSTTPQIRPLITLSLPTHRPRPLESCSSSSRADHTLHYARIGTASTAAFSRLVFPTLVCFFVHTLFAFGFSEVVFIQLVYQLLLLFGLHRDCAI